MSGRVSGNNPFMQIMIPMVHHRCPMTDTPDSEQLLARATQQLERRDAEILLAHAWLLTRAQLLARAGDPVPAEVVERFAASCERRASGVPVAYLLGQREFWSLPLEVTPAVLVPRPDTE